MSFEHSSSLDDLLQSCKQESESVVIPELPEETPQPASADTTPTEAGANRKSLQPEFSPAGRSIVLLNGISFSHKELRK